MYAVVEPYVIGAQLQSELMKRGLICNQTGPGRTARPSDGSASGHGHLSQERQATARESISFWEWVTPDGDIVRLGSLGDSGAWFCGDGPGLPAR